MKYLTVGLALVFSINNAQAWNYSLPLEQNNLNQSSFISIENGTRLNTDLNSNPCVSFPRPVVGQKSKYISKSPNDNTSYTFTREVMDVTNNTLVEDITGSGTELTGVIHSTQSYSIINMNGNSYLNTLVERQDFNVNLNMRYYQFNQRTYYSGQKLTPVSSICARQDWAYSYDVNTLITEASISSVDEENFSGIWANSFVKGLHISKTVPAGTFDTFQYKTVGKIDGVNQSITRWVDLLSGVLVLEVRKDEQGNLLESVELQSKY